MPEVPFQYRAITDREKLTMPNGARLALWIGVNIEYFDYSDPILTPGGVMATSPSPFGYGHYLYGLRVGLYRLMNLMDKYEIKGSVLLNSEVCDNFPSIIEEGNARGWRWLAHGQRNSISQNSFTSIESEREYLQKMVHAITANTGKAPRGWLGPAGSESHNTLELLAECGLDYVCDWTADDLPFALNVKSGPMVNVPYAVDGLNDVRLRDRAFTGEDYFRLIVDQFDMLYAESETIPRVMCLAIHPHISGQPFRVSGMDRALKYISSHDGVWKTTSDEIADWYYASGDI